MTSDPREDKSRIEQIKGGLLEDAFQWIFDNEVFNNWRNEPENRILWIKGDAGKGKTMLLCGLIDVLPKLHTDIVLAFVFCQANNAEMNDATSVLRGIIYMLVIERPTLLKYVRAKYDSSGKSLFQRTNKNSWFALVKILSSILAELPSTCIVVDALDECSTDLTVLLDFISSKSAAFPHIKWILSSRNWPMIEEQLKKESQKLVLSLEDNSNLISTAVAKYVAYKASQLAELKGHDSRTQEAVRTRLLAGAEGTFLWVALVYQNLVDTYPWDTLEALESMPQGLKSLYHRMVTRIHNSKNAELYKQILRVVLMVYRPVTLNELFRLTEMLDHSHSWQYRTEIIESCGSFLTIRGSTVFFVHQSATEFLVEDAHEIIFTTGFESVHRAISRQSLKCLSETLTRDIYNIKDQGCLINDIKAPDPDPLAPARYACIYWVDHLHDGIQDHQLGDLDIFFGDKGLVHEFLTRRYLFWLESLSIMRSIFEGTEAMIKLERLVHVSSMVSCIPGPGFLTNVGNKCY